YEKQHARMQDPYFREGYLKMNAAMNEGYWYTIGFFAGSLTAMYTGPYVLSYGSMAITAEAELLSLSSSGAWRAALATPLGEMMLKTGLDISAQALFKPAGDINPMASLAGAMIPGSSYGSGVLSGGVNESTTLIMEYSINPENVGAKEVLTSGVKSAIAAPGGMYLGNLIEGIVGSKAAGST